MPSLSPDERRAVDAFEGAVLACTRGVSMTREKMLELRAIKQLRGAEIGTRIAWLHRLT